MENLKALSFIAALIIGSHIAVEFMMQYAPYVGIIIAPAIFTYLAINAVRYYNEAYSK